MKNRYLRSLLAALAVVTSGVALAANDAVERHLLAQRGMAEQVGCGVVCRLR